MLTAEILAPTVKVQYAWCFLLAECVVQSTQDELGIVTSTHAPTHNLTTKDVNDCTDVIPPAHAPQVRKVTGPDLVWLGSNSMLIFENIWWCWPRATVLLVVTLVW